MLHSCTRADTVFVIQLKEMCGSECDVLGAQLEFLVAFLSFYATAASMGHNLPPL